MLEYHIAYDTDGVLLVDMEACAIHVFARRHASGLASSPLGATGYLCFGRTPMTDATVDLYWMAVAPGLQGKGIGRALVDAFEARVLDEGGRIVHAETSTREGYGKTLAFYLRLDCLEAGRIPNFYTDGDDLVTLWKPLG